MRTLLLPFLVLTSLHLVAQREVRVADSIEKRYTAMIEASGNQITKAFVLLSSGDSSINLVYKKWNDYRFFGYSKPSVQSERLLLLSIFTDEVKDNHYKCKLGAYYNTGQMSGVNLQYRKKVGQFIQAVAIDESHNETVLYFERKWIMLE